MRIRRTLPPSAAPLSLRDLWSGFKGFLAGETYLKSLEEGIKEYFGVRYVFLVSSGKAALYLILCSLKSLRPVRSEVLIPAYTCFSVPSAIVRAGLKVTLCDIDASSLDFDQKLLAEGITNQTLCVVPNHLFGIPSRMDDIVKLCRKRNVFVLEDAAQAMGGRHGGKFLGTMGDVGFFSLGRGKSVTCGSGGIIVTNSEVIGGAIEREYSRLVFPRTKDDVAEYIKAAMMSLFIRPQLYWIPAALPFLKLGRTFFDSRFPAMRLSPMQAGLCIDWRRRLETTMSVRKKQAAMFCRRLKGQEPVGGVSSLPYLRLPFLVESRDRKRKICAASNKKGLGITQMYPFPINDVPQIAHRFEGAKFPAARFVAERLVTIPLHKWVNDKDRDEMVRLLLPVGSRHDRETAGSFDVVRAAGGLVGKERA